MAAGRFERTALSVPDRGASRVGIVAVLLVLTFLHFAAQPIFRSWFASPNLLLCGLLVSARGLRPGSAALVGFVLGLLEDAMAVSYFGLATLLLVLIGYLGSQTRDLFLGEEPLFMGTYLFVGTWIYEAATYLLMGGGTDWAAHLLLRAPLDGVLTGALGYLVVPFVRPR